MSGSPSKSPWNHTLLQCVCQWGILYQGTHDEKSSLLNKTESNKRLARLVVARTKSWRPVDRTIFLFLRLGLVKPLNNVYHLTRTAPPASVMAHLSRCGLESMQIQSFPSNNTIFHHKWSKTKPTHFILDFYYYVAWATTARGEHRFLRISFSVRVRLFGHNSIRSTLCSGIWCLAYTNLHRLLCQTMRAHIYEKSYHAADHMVWRMPVQFMWKKHLKGYSGFFIVFVHSNSASNHLQSPL